MTLWTTDVSAAKFSARILTAFKQEIADLAKSHADA